MPRRSTQTLEQRLLKNTEKTDTCWLWLGYKRCNGYGALKVDAPKNKIEYAHRIAYKLWKGSIPDHLDVCHSCDVRNCINPDHLWVGTHQENMNDAFSKGRIPNKKYNNKHDGT